MAPSYQHTPTNDSLAASLPEIGPISERALREMVVQAWVLSLDASSCQSIDEIPGSGVPGSPLMRRGSQLEHLRGVSRIAQALGIEMREGFPELPIDNDMLLACALCHDESAPLLRNR